MESPAGRPCKSTISRCLPCTTACYKTDSWSALLKKRDPLHLRCALWGTCNPKSTPTHDCARYLGSGDDQRSRPRHTCPEEMVFADLRLHSEKEESLGARHRRFDRPRLYDNLISALREPHTSSSRIHCITRSSRPHWQGSSVSSRLLQCCTIKGFGRQSYSARPPERARRHR